MKQTYVIFSSGSTELSERIMLNGYIAFEYFWYPRHYLGVASGHCPVYLFAKSCMEKILISAFFFSFTSTSSWMAHSMSDYSF